MNKTIRKVAAEEISGWEEEEEEGKDEFVTGWREQAKENVSLLRCRYLHIMTRN
jgi:hypothetical protein